MPSNDSVTEWLRRLERGDDTAANLLWQRYCCRLVQLARKRLGTASRRIADEEDVALSVFRCLCDDAVRGRFTGLGKRDELWRLLATMTDRKAVDHARLLNRRKRGGGRVRGDSALRGKQPLDTAPSPELLAMMSEEHERLMNLLDENRLRQIVLWKLEGYENEEIAERLDLTCRSVERKLKRIREAWEGQLDS